MKKTDPPRKELILSPRFKRDMKKFRNQIDVLKELQEIVNLLLNGQVLPQKYKAHKLKGNYAGHLECHVENDLLLIWYDQITNQINLVRFGTHSELFSKKHK